MQKNATFPWEGGVATVPLPFAAQAARPLCAVTGAPVLHYCLFAEPAHEGIRRTPPASSHPPEALLRGLARLLLSLIAIKGIIHAMGGIVNSSHEDFT